LIGTRGLPPLDQSSVLYATPLPDAILAMYRAPGEREGHAGARLVHAGARCIEQTTRSKPPQVNNATTPFEAHSVVLGWRRLTMVIQMIRASDSGQ